jgi:glycerophosphoryl diester phosphodiesterase
MNRLKRCGVGLLVVAAFAATATATAVQTNAQEPRRPAIVAHRGLLLDAPENTLANFSACLQLRLGFEFDVRRCKTGELVCVHDSSVDRTTDGQGQVADLTLAEIKKLDAGSWFSPEFRGERVPTIDAVLALIAAHKVPGLYTVDLKSDDAEVERDTVRLAKKHGVLERLLFIGRTIDHAEVRSRLRSADPNCRTAAVANTRDQFAAALAATDADWVYLRFVPTDAEVKQIHDAKKRAFLAGATITGREPAAWLQAAQAGVDGMLTDYAPECRRAIRAAK